MNTTEECLVSELSEPELSNSEQEQQLQLSTIKKIKKEKVVSASTILKREKLEEYLKLVKQINSLKTKERNLMKELLKMPDEKVKSKK